MKILIIGAGEVGMYSARVLSQENHQIVMIDENRSRLDWIEESLDVQVVQGHGCAAGVLERAGAWGADIVLAVTNNDEVNMLAAYLAKLQGAKRTIIRIKGGEHLRFHRQFYSNSLGFDTVIVPTELCSEEIAELVRSKQAVAVENFAHGQIQMRLIQVEKKSPWANLKLSKVKMPKDTLVAAIIRGAEIMIPNGDSEIHPDDELLLIGNTGSMNGIDKIGGKKKDHPNLIVIVGGGELGFSVARSLEYSDLRVRVIELDRGRAEALSEELDDVVVFHGDGTDMNLLKEVGADHADVFVSASGKDELNLISAQLAKTMGAKKTIALVKKSDYVSIYQKLGVDAAISPRLLVANKLLSYVRSGAISSIAVIAEGKAEVIEMKAMADSKVVSAPLMKLGIPKGAIIGSVVRDNKVYIPDGGFQIQPDDSCIIFTFLETLPQVERFFKGKKKSFLSGIKGG